MDWKTALALGCVMSMSSTAVVIKLTADRSELETEHASAWSVFCYFKTWPWFHC